MNKNYILRNTRMFGSVAVHTMDMDRLFGQDWQHDAREWAIRNRLDITIDPITNKVWFGVIGVYAPSYT